LVGDIKMGAQTGDGAGFPALTTAAPAAAMASLRARGMQRGDVRGNAGAAASGMSRAKPEQPTASSDWSN